MPINYPHIRTLAAAAAHDAVGFAARALARAGATFASAFEALRTRFPSVQIRSLSRIMDQAISSINAALKMGAAGPGGTVPVNQYGVNPSAVSRYEYRVVVTLDIRRPGQAEHRRHLDVTVRSSTPLDPDAITLRGELLAESIAYSDTGLNLPGGQAVVVSSEIRTATVRGQL